MMQVILFGGGDAGGIYIDANGKVHRIPPFDPYAASLTRAFASLVTAESYARGSNEKEAAAFADQVQESFVAHVERSIGASVGAAGIVYDDPTAASSAAMAGAGRSRRRPRPRPRRRDPRHARQQSTKSRSGERRPLAVLNRAAAVVALFEVECYLNFRPRYPRRYAIREF